MAVGIGAAGMVGLAHEATPGTYVAPTFFLPVRSESINYDQEVTYTRPIRGEPDPIHAVKGNAHVNGDIEFEVIEDGLAFLLYGARMDVTKAGADPYTYTFDPSNAAEAPNKTLSITVVRNGVVFGYTNCVVPTLEFSVDSGLFICTAGIMGSGEGTQSGPTATWPTTAPYGADKYTIEVGGAGVTTVDNVTWALDDSGEAEFRLGSLDAAYIKFGERSVEATYDMDFETKTEYDNFKNITERQFHLRAEKDASHYVDIDTYAMIQSSHEVGLQGQGDLVRGSVELMGKYDETNTQVYTIDIGTDLSIS